MTLTQLKYFQTICKYNNITRAAAELHISQPSLSNAVKELEQEFGVTLFNRRSHGLELTAEGHYLLDEATKLLAHAETLAEHMSRLSGVNRSVTLGLPAMSGSLVFADLLQALHTFSPDTHIQVMESGSISNRQKILDRTLDAAIITRNSPLPTGFNCIPLRNVSICLYVSAAHPLAATGITNIRFLDELPLALLPEDTFLSSYITQYYQEHHLKLNPVVRTNQLTTIHQLIAGNAVSAFLLENVLEESSDIVSLHVPDIPEAEIDLIWKSHRNLPSHMQKLIDAARSIAIGT